MRTEPGVSVSHNRRANLPSLPDAPQFPMITLQQPATPVLLANGPIHFRGRADVPGELLLRCGRRRVRCHRDPATQAFWSSFETRAGIKIIDLLHIDQGQETVVARRTVWNLTGKPTAGTYAQWVRRYDTLSDKDLQAIRSWQATFASKPAISILLPVYHPPLEFLRAAVESVRQQTWPHWQLCIADDASPSAEIRDYLVGLPEQDERIQVVLREENGHISHASNSALELAEKEWLTLLDHDDQLAPHALTLMAHAILTNPEGRFFYSDEDKIDEQNRRSDPYFKPDWNPSLICSHNHVTHLALYPTEQVREAGGFRTGFEGAQDWDLVLRMADTVGAEHIVHLPYILYHWRSLATSTASGIGAKHYAIEAGRRAVREHLKRHQIEAEVADGPWGGSFRVIPTIEEWPAISIVIPTRDRLELLKRCVDTLHETTDYQNFEIVIIDNQSQDPETLRWLEAETEAQRLRVVSYDAPFNYAAMNNVAVNTCRSPLILFLNNDMEIVESGWLKEMARQLLRPGVGAVGAKLLYPDHTVQHAGVTIGPGYGASHAYREASEDAPGHNGRLQLIQDYSAVTAACLLTRRADFLEVGGFDAEAFPVAYNDVDFCLKLREQGKRILYTPHALLLHHESASRGDDKQGEKRERFEREKKRFREKWSRYLVHDPAYNPNLTIHTDHFDCAFPPRVDRPWTGAD